MIDRERALRSNCPTMCPCICHDGYGGAHPNQRCRDKLRERADELEGK